MPAQRYYLILCAFSAVSLLLPSCATKKYVTAQVTPVVQRVQKAEVRNTEQDQQIDVLETESSKTRESLADVKQNINGLDTKLKSTSETAQGAATAASQAQQQAADARKYAAGRASDLERNLEKIDQFKLARTIHVLFDAGKSELGPDSKASLDGVAQQASELHRYALEIEGFTDNTGRPAANITLSQRRAESVVRYLTVSRNLPLRNIHLIGAGSAAPVADNTTRSGRRQNRRVEIRIFAPEPNLTSTGAGSAAAQLR